MRAASRIVRQRKLNKSTLQPVLREDEIESTEFDSLQSQYETGVEKGEENEYHLQVALKGAGKENEEIPAPTPERTKDIDYDALYARKFIPPHTYLRVSYTVEESIPCHYDMVSEDDTWLQEYNQKKSASKKCSEDDFERIMEIFEDTAKNTTPFAAVDNTLVPVETMSAQIKPRLPKLLDIATDVYEHWKARREASGNNSLQPSLKFETHQENDDADPYVCFRRREIRQTRKTRQRDVQSTDKLKSLRNQLEEGRELATRVFQREMQKRDFVKLERTIFEERYIVKIAKRKLGIKTDDEDLINQKPPKRKISELYQRGQQGVPARLPGRPDGRPLDSELQLLSDLLAQKENLLQREIEEKTQQHRKWNQGHVDLTREPLSPVNGQGPETGFRPATAQYQYLMTPPSSVTSETFDQPSPAQDKPETLSFRYSSPPEEEHRGQPAYRRRIGRGGRLWIDRRGMSSAVKDVGDNILDRWKYDQDDDDEQPVYEVDPYDTKALRFRASIPLPASILHQYSRPDPRARPAGPNPANSRAIPVVQHPLPPVPG